MPNADLCWLVKQEPSAYSWDDLVKDGRTAWTGVRNFQARKHLRTMAVGNLVFFYHSVIGKAVVGIAKVVRAAYPDPTAADEGWVSVDIAPVRPLARPVTLDQIKAVPDLREIPLVRQGRLSVQPLTRKQFDAIVALGEQP